MANLMLGKLHHVHDRRTLLLERYTTEQLPQPPASVTLSSKVSNWPMMANDQLGDCVIAMAGHATQLWTAVTGAEITPPDQEIVQDYSQITGYKPGDPSTDNGTAIIDLLNWWRRNPIGTKEIFAFAEIQDPTNHQVVMQGHALFEGLLVGVALPRTAQAQIGSVWDVVAAPPSQNGPGTWGGHGIYVIDYDAQGLTCVTWGKLQRMTWAWWDEYVDECWVALPAEFEGAAGFDWNALTQDLLQLGVV